MKKLVLCLIGAAAMIFTANAQEKSVLGVRAGMNISNVSLSNGGVSVSLSSRVGYNVGISYQVPLVSKFYLETGLNLTSRGATIDAGQLDTDIDGKLKFNMLYLQLPVAFSWHFDISSVSIQPFVGAYYNFGIHGKLKAEAGGMTEKINMFKDTSYDGEVVPQPARRSDVGLRFGAGVTFRQKYYLGLGYDLGLTNIFTKEWNEQTMGTKAKNGNFFISVGYNF